MATTAQPPASPRRGSAPRFGMAWVTWRQHRAGLAATAALFGGLSLYMLVTGLHMRSEFSALGLASCRHVTAGRCTPQLALFDTQDQLWRYVGEMLLLAAPVLSGVFMGAPLVARELSTGTFQFAWTQGTGRATWMIVKLALLGTAVTASAAAVSLMFSWWLAPFWGPA